MSFLVSRVSRRIATGVAVPQQRVMLCRNYSEFLVGEKTPNPSAMKFVYDGVVLPEKYGTGMSFESKTDPNLRRSPLAEALMKRPEVESVFLGNNFVTVTKFKDQRWKNVKYLVTNDLAQFMSDELPAIDEFFEESTTIRDTTILDTDSEVVAAIKELMETRVRPSVQEDGGDIFYVDFVAATGIVKVRLAGSCVGCPSSSITLRNGVENMLMHYIPEVKGIEEVTAASEAFNANEAAEAAGEGGPLKLSFKPDPVVQHHKQSGSSHSGSVITSDDNVSSAHADDVAFKG